MKNRNWYLSTSALNGVMSGVMTGILAAGFGPAASAADLSPIAPAQEAPLADGLPAVSGINAKFSGFGGWEEYGFGPAPQLPVHLCHLKLILEIGNRP